MIETTLQKIWDKKPCEESWQQLLNYLDKNKPDDKPLNLLTILESNGLQDAVWVLRTLTGYDREIRLYACRCACRVLPIFETKYPQDPRPRIAVETAALFAEGLETNAAAEAAAVAAIATTTTTAAHAAAIATATTAIAAAVVYNATTVATTQSWLVKEFINLCESGKKYLPLI